MKYVFSKTCPGGGSYFELPFHSIHFFNKQKEDNYFFLWLFNNVPDYTTVQSTNNAPTREKFIQIIAPNNMAQSQITQNSYRSSVLWESGDISSQNGDHGLSR